MDFSGELNFMCDVLRKCRMQTVIVSRSDRMQTLLDSFLEKIIGLRGSYTLEIGDILKEIREGTKYQITNELDLRYVLIPLPIEDERSLLFFGPYLPTPLDEGEVMKIGERLGLAPSAHRFLVEYFSTLPIVSENDRLTFFIDNIFYLPCYIVIVRF